LIPNKQSISAKSNENDKAEARTTRRQTDLKKQEEDQRDARRQQDSRIVQQTRQKRELLKAME